MYIKAHGMVPGHSASGVSVGKLREAIAERKWDKISSGLWWAECPDSSEMPTSWSLQHVTGKVESRLQIEFRSPSSDLEMRRWDYPWLSKWAHWNPKGSSMWKRQERERARKEREGLSVRTWPNVDAFEVGGERGPWTKEGRVDCRRRRRVLHKGASPAATLISARWDPFWTSDL